MAKRETEQKDNRSNPKEKINLGSKPPLENGSDESKASQKLSRSSFLKLMGATAVMAHAACRRPVEQIVPAVTRAPETQPGVSTFYSSVTPNGTGIIIRAREGRPIKIAGNPDHPLTRGGVSAYNAASLLDLYDPDRLRRPAVLDQKSGRKKYSEKNLTLLVAKTQLKKGDYALLSGPIDSPSTAALIKDFLALYPGGRHIEFCPDPTLRQIKEGQEFSYGQSSLPLYRFDRADMVLSLEADFLGSMPMSEHYANSFAQRRSVRRRGNLMSRLIVFESMFSLTGSNADERYAIRPGDQPLIALALAAYIVINMQKSPFVKDSIVRDFLLQYLPENVTLKLKQEEGLYKKGQFERTIARLGEELWANRRKSLVIGGSPLTSTGSNAAGQITINLLNSILGNDGITVDHQSALKLSCGASDREIQSLIGDLKTGRIKSLILSHANLVYHLPQSLKVSEALQKTPYILALHERIDETARLANAVLPTSHFLESWRDSEVVSNIFSIQQPVIRPLYQTLSFEDWLIQLADGEISGAKNFYEYLKNRWRKNSSLPASAGRPKGFDRFWISFLQNGYFAPQLERLDRRAGSRPFQSESIYRLPQLKEGAWNKVEQNKLYLGLYYNIQVADGQGANNAQRQELPDPVTKIVWDNYVSLLPETARRLSLRQGSLVELQTAQGLLKLPVHLQPGLHHQSALVALGYGRTACGQVANGVGQNAAHLIEPGSDSLTFAGMAAEIKATGQLYELASTQVIYRNGTASEEKAPFLQADMHSLPYRGSSQHGRAILRETTYAEFQSGNYKLRPEPAQYPRKQEIVPPWKYENTRWQMTIDLNSCIGCAACVTSCNAENNVPMVGKEEVKVGREMHWLRIDRYFSGEETSPEMAHQPMLCQHCENAPCENVCPVAATTHDKEGLNVMTYNRCIGTRYCSSNCPYKVRRFNWFENWNYWEGLRRKIREPQHLSLNPDVTVRSRGVMEKCTFCVQRISAARQESKARGEKFIPDDRVITACQEVCPADAISFGNILDPRSKVSQLTKKQKRGYRVLEALGVEPSVTYLAKIRNVRKS